MEALLTYIIKSGGLLLLFYCAYYFLLRKETFFNSNRWFLLAGLFTSVILPFIVYTKTIWVDPTPLSGNNYQIYTPETNTAESYVIDWNFALIAIYAIGFIGLVLKFAFDFYSLNSVLKGKKIKQQADFKFVDIKENIAPFSYFDYIVYNSSLYSASELESIIEHEKVHSEQNHTIDVLVSRIFCVLFWFNPIVWLYKKVILQNLEFIADNEAAQKIADKKAYQYTLLKITTHDTCVAITNHFYQSLIKKRIIMLNKNQSKKRNSWKFGVIIPALIAFVLLFQVEVIAKEKEATKKEVLVKLSKEKTAPTDIYKINKSTTDQELKEIKEKLKAVHNIDFETSEIKRNAQSDLTSIKVSVKKGNQQAQSIQTSGNQTIKDFGIVITTDKEGGKKIGIQTGNETDKEPESSTTKNQKTKRTINNTNSTVNSITNTNPDHNAEANYNTNKNASTSTTTNINVNADTKTTTKVVVTSNVNGKTTSNVLINSKSQPNVRITSDKLIIVDGVIVDGVTTEDLQKLSIESMNVYKGSTAIKEYGEAGANGVIVIETKK